MIAKAKLLLAGGLTKVLVCQLVNFIPFFIILSKPCFMNHFSRIMGAPEEREWPDVPLPWSSFKNYKKQPLESVIPDIGPQELDLLEVRPLLFLMRFKNSTYN